MTAFALLCRGRGDRLEILTGPPVAAASVAALPTADRPVFAAVPYRQITERGMPCADDGAPLLAFSVERHTSLPLAAALSWLPSDPAALGAGRFDLDDDAYAALVRAVVAGEIGRGTGSNFVLRRTFRASLGPDPARAALALFRRLLVSERGAYWTFLVHCEGRTLVGASPECQAGLRAGVATMNPISGTYRYPPGGPTAAGLRAFLADRKESDELFMVVDEELKTMARICDGGGRVRGPWLRPMSRLAHTEYRIEGPTRLDPRAVLLETLPAPTVAGSPLAAACRVIADHEPDGRGYYGGAVALIGRDWLDSALLIRTAEISADGSVRVSAGATLVRHSDPAAEAAETRAKAAALVDPPPSVRYWKAPAGPADEGMGTMLAARNEGLSRFWRGLSSTWPDERLAGARILVVDAEDDFTAMLARLLEALGTVVRVERYDTAKPDDHDAVVLGPGPGDPGDAGDPRIARLRELARERLTTGAPLLAVCLGHQVVAAELGLAVRRLPRPEQGVQRVVAPYGRVGFYNTFTAVSPADVLTSPLTGRSVRVTRDPATGVVHALAAPGVRSMQFHVESVLTEHGPAILRRMLAGVLAPDAPGGRPNGCSPRSSTSPRMCA
ncbi:anthranilate synthase family protein [Dactylosporangium sp. AC04546]|uniref:anthranilate synthase family protein n=1 Tax=Dactylosporangium sp. AC04546 TaxID=2862460 RepID=UPI001EDCCD88|nr:anthranilate synthase family protein [Dactylosporangium sp. AC04546]WVK87486.1 anthranilate synthase family protein [Dactylosporangium sp. AC04546]